MFQNYNECILNIFAIPIFGSDCGPRFRYLCFLHPTTTPPAGGRALSPQPAISLCTCQIGSHGPRPPPAGIPHSKGRLLKHVISPYTFIPSTLSSLSTSPVVLSLPPSMSRLRWHHLSWRDAPCTPKYQKEVSDHGENK